MAVRSGFSSFWNAIVVLCLFGATGCNVVQTELFSVNPLIPSHITITDHGTAKSYPTGGLLLLTNDKNLQLSGPTKPAAKVKVYVSANGECSYPLSEDDKIIGESSSITPKFNVALETLPEGKFTLCLYAESPASEPAWVKLGELIIKRTVLDFANLEILPKNRSPDRLPRVKGIAESDTVVSLHSGSGCQGVELNSVRAGNAGEFEVGLPSFNPLQVDGVIDFFVLATDSIGNSICSVAVAYTLDTMINPSPTIYINPSSPSFDPQPKLSGITELNSKVYLHNSMTCSDSSLGVDSTLSDGSYEVFPASPLTDEVLHNFTLRVVDDLGNSQCFSSLSNPYVFDITPPLLEIKSPIAGAEFYESFALSVTCEVPSRVTIKGDVTSIISKDCVNGELTFTMNLSDVDGSKTVIAEAEDPAGNITTKSVVLVKDTTPPVLPLVVRTSPSPTSMSHVYMTVSDCSDIKDVLIKENSSLPSGSAVEWQSCTEVVGGTSYDLSTLGTQGTRNLRVFVRDRIGNIQPSFVTVLVAYDTLPPEIKLTNIPLFLGTLSDYEFQWSLTEGNVPSGAKFQFTYSQNDGVTWNTLAAVPVGIIGAVNGKVYKHVQKLPPTPGPIIFKVSLTDATAQTGFDAKQATLLFDITPPVVDPNSFKILGSEGPITTYNPFVKVSFSATDNQTPIMQFCLKTVLSTPTLTDPCWIALDAPGVDVPVDLSVSLNDYDHLLDWAQGTYTVYLWIRDQAGNISANSGPVNGGRERIEVKYERIPDPEIKELIVSKSPDSIEQPEPWELVTSPGTLLHLKWKQRVYIGEPVVSIWYTKDGVSYELIDEGLSSDELNCEPSGLEFNCSYAWNSFVPVNISYKIQLRLSDEIGQTANRNSVYISNPNFRPIAGNTDPGTEGSAKKAAFRGLFPDSGSFVMTRNGLLVYRDIERGLLIVDPENGVQKVLLPNTGVISGYTGFVKDATTEGILKIAIDFQDRVLLFEPDRIRRIDMRANPMTIETIIGAFDDGRVGSSSDDFVADPQNVKIKLNSVNRLYGMGVPYLTFLVLPNGDIYFQTESLGTSTYAGSRMRVYRGSAVEPYVETLRVGGAGDYADGATNIAYWRFMNLSFVFDPFSKVVYKGLALQDHPTPGCNNVNFAALSPTTLQSLGGGHPWTPFSTCFPNHVIQGMDGRVYAMNRNNPWSFAIVRHDNSVGWNTVVGNGLRSRCADDTPALSCAIIPNDVFVSITGQIYFIDDGLIRTVTSDNRIHTLYGYNLNGGDGGPAPDARLNNVVSLNHGAGDKVIVLDNQGGKFREISYKGTPGIITIAGNGDDGPGSQTPIGVAADKNPLGMSWMAAGRFASDPTNGDVYWSCGYQYICKLDRSTNTWGRTHTLAGSTSWTTTLAVHANNLEVPPYWLAPINFVGGKVIVGFTSWNGTDSYRAAIREFDLANGNTKFVVGNNLTHAQASCPNGSASNCTIDSSYIGFYAGIASSTFFGVESGNNKWLILTNGNKTVNKVGGGTVQKIFDLENKAQSMLVAGNYFYYCSVPLGHSKSVLYRKSLTTPFEEYELKLPHGSTCDGNSIIFKKGQMAEPDRLVFPIKQNGISGVAEFLEPEGYVQP